MAIPPPHCWLMPATAMNGTCRSWKPGALRAMWPWAGRGTLRQSGAPRDRPPGAWRANWTRPGFRKFMPSASGWWKHASVGLSVFWAFAHAVCAACAPCRASGIWCVWPRVSSGGTLHPHEAHVPPLYAVRAPQAPGLNPASTCRHPPNPCPRLFLQRKLLGAKNRMN